MTTLCQMLSSQISIQGKSLACRLQFCYTQVWVSMDTAPDYQRVTLLATFFSVHKLLAFFSRDSPSHSWPLKVTLLKLMQLYNQFVTNTSIKGKHQFSH